MSFEWSDQPYRWLYEKRDNYTQAIIGTTRYHAIQVREEGEAWMKEHAPWKDKNIYEGDRLRFRAGNAREHLAVELRFTGEVSKELAMRLEVGQAAARYEAPRGGKRAAVAARTAEITKAFVAKQELIVELLFRHGSEKEVPYAIWLEVAHGGRYGIISRATEYWGRKMLGRIHSFMNLKQFRKEVGVQPVTHAEAFKEYMAGGVTSTGQPIRGSYTPEVRSMKRQRKRYYDPVAAKQRRQENREYTNKLRGG